MIKSIFLLVTLFLALAWAMQPLGLDGEQQRHLQHPQQQHHGHHRVSPHQHSAVKHKLHKTEHFKHGKVGLKHHMGRKFQSKTRPETKSAKKTSTMPKRHPKQQGTHHQKKRH